MNRCTFIGSFVHDPRLSTQSKGEGHEVSFTNFRLAIPHKFRKSNKESASHTAFLDFEACGSGAEVICSKFKRGNTIIIEAMAKTYRSKVDQNQSNTVFRIEHFEPLPDVTSPSE